MKRKVTKVKHNPDQGKTLVEFTGVENEDRAKTGLESTDPPRPELAQALKALRQDVERVCELDEGYVTAVRGVSLAWDEAGDVKVVISGLRTIEASNSPFVINTPQVTPPSRERIDVLVDEALKFLDGERAQQRLELEGEAQADPQPKADPPKAGRGRKK